MSAPKPVRHWLVLIFAALGTAFLLGMSYWQYSKIAAKDLLIAQILSRAELPPIEMPADVESDPDWIYRTVIAKGRLLADNARHIYRAGPKGGPGYQLLVPLVRLGGQGAWVDLGWFPETQKARYEKPDLPLGFVDLPAMIFPRQRSPKIIAPPPPEPDANRYYRLQPEVLGNGLDLNAATSVYLIAAMTLPQTPDLMLAPPPVKLENNHRSYALQWFLMAIGLIAISALFLKRQRDVAKADTSG